LLTIDILGSIIGFYSGETILEISEIPLASGLVSTEGFFVEAACIEKTGLTPIIS